MENNETKQKQSKCRSCGAPIVFLKTKRGANMPVDVVDGSECDDSIFLYGHHSSHFDTCEDADKYRRNKT